MSRLLTVFATGLLASTLAVAADTLEDVLEDVRRQRSENTAESAARIERFRRDRDEQAQRLRDARDRLDQLERESASLREQFARNREELLAQQSRLNAVTENTAQLIGVTREVAGEVHGLLQQSLITAEYHDRLQPLEKLAGSRRLPPPAQIETLWQAMVQEIVEQHRISQFETTVIGPDGGESRAGVRRVGPFTLHRDNQFLRFLPETGIVLTPAEQPSARLRRALVAGTAGDAAGPVAVIDPTRGGLVSLLGQRASLSERIRQGGPVGAVIIALGVIGLGIAAQRWLALARTLRRTRRQATSEAASDDNPLGRLMRVSEASPEADADALGLRLDEAILAELPRLRRGLSFLALLTGLAPLLGLLGTVTGIIETFQAITLFGTGDPRLMAGGISQALVTTVLGLLVAIPMTLLHNALNERSNRIVATLDEASAGLIADRAEYHADTLRRAPVPAASR